MSKKRLIFLFAFLFLFFVFATLVFTGHSDIIDIPVYDFIFSFRSDFLDHYFIFITKFGNTLTILIVVFAFLLLVRNAYAIFLGASACTCILSNTLIKQIIRRIRPEHLRLIVQGGYSFPSGHAMISVCVYGYLLHFVWKKVSNRYLRGILVFFLIFLIFSIGCSRIYVGVHYPTDVLAGYCLAISEVLLIIEIADRIYAKGGKDKCIN